MSSSTASFPYRFDPDGDFSFGPGSRSSGYFGTDTLRRLIAGIDDFRSTAEHQAGSRTLGPAMLGAFMWLDDPELLQRIADIPYASVVITKQPRNKHQQARLNKLKPLLEHGPGFPARALPELHDLMLREDGKAPLIGPSTPQPDLLLPAIRTIGYRKASNRLVPILHTKMLLVGELWWHDEDALGHVADVIGFSPKRLWLSSANGTESSRGNLEFGVWLDDPSLLHKAKQFLGWVLSHSEDLDPDADGLEPELVEPAYDDEAFAEAIAFLADESDGEPQ